MEQIVFQARTHYTKEMVKRGVRGMAQIPPYRTVFTLFRTLLVMMAVFVLIVGASYFIQEKTALGVLGVLQAVLYTALGVCFPRVVCWAIWICMPKTRLDNRFDFTGSGFVNDDGKKRRTFDYGKLKVLLESKDCFYLCTSTGGLCPIEKKGFTYGESEAFKAFIKEKCPTILIETIEGV